MVGLARLRELALADQVDDRLSKANDHLASICGLAAPPQPCDRGSGNAPFTIDGVRRAVDRIGGRLPQGWGDLFRQLGLFAIADVFYETVRGIADGKQQLAFAHGQQLIDLER
jgi:hypothetical protein